MKGGEANEVSLPSPLRSGSREMGGGEAERSGAYTPPRVSGGEANEVSLLSPLRSGSREMGGQD